MNSKIELKIRTEEPVIIPVAGGDPNTVETQTFIPGAVLLGAFAGFWLKKRKYPSDAEKNEEFREFFLDNKVYWHNGLPLVDNGHSTECFRTIPFCIQKTPNGKIYNAFDFENSEGVKIKPLPPFGAYDEDTVKLADIRVGRDFHMERDRESGSGKDGVIFHYEFIPAGVEFCSEISGKMETLQKLYDVFSACEQIFIGRSKGVQYGTASLKWKKPENIKIDFPDEDDEWLIVLESDTILLNENGYPEPSIALLEKELGLFEITKANIKTVVFEGFNAKRKAFRPGGMAIKAGSCIQFSAQNCKDKELLQKAVVSGIGQRRSEGYGRISVVVNPSLELTELKAEKSLSDKLSKDEIRIASPLVEKILTEQILQQAVSAAFTKAEGVKINASPSCLSRVLVFLMNMETWDSNEFNNKFLSQLKRKAKEQLENTFVDGGSLCNFLSKQIPYEPEPGICDCLQKYDVGNMSGIQAKAGLVFLKTMIKSLRKKAKGGRE